MGNKCGCNTKKTSELAIIEENHRFEQENVGPNVKITNNGKKAINSKSGHLKNLVSKIIMEGPGKHIFRVQLGEKNEYSEESADIENTKWGVGVGVIKAKSSFVYDPEEPCSPCMPLNNWIIC